MPDAKKTPGFSTTFGRGFHLTFDNGYTVSVQWGRENYCEHHAVTFSKNAYGEVHRSVDAEVAVWDADGEWATREVWKDIFGEDIGDDVQGWVSPDDVATLIYRVKTLKRKL